MRFNESRASGSILLCLTVRCAVTQVAMAVRDHDVQNARDQDYFKRGASMYNQWLSPYINATVNCILNHLPITPDDVIVDIGGGTGEVAQRVWKQAQLKSPVLCVDPSEEMLEMAKGKEGIETLQATAEEFFLSEMASSKKFTKVLICGCSYLFTDPEAVYAGLKACLGPTTKGASCIVSNLTYLSPVMPAAAEIYMSGLMQKEFEVKSKLFDQVGLKWKAFDVVGTHPIGKSDWYDLLRTRMLRCTQPLSAAEVEMGIQVMEEKYGDQEMLDLDMRLKVAILEIP